MLTIDVGGEEAFDDASQEFLTMNATTLQLEHSLVSLSKWEAKYEKPFLSNERKTTEEVHFYIQAMCLTPDVPPELFEQLKDKHYAAVNKYIEAKMTATWFNEEPNGPRSHEIITSEIVYYWMIALNIPFECQYWHFNRLLTLVKVCNEKNKPQKNKKTPMRNLAAQRRALNEQRKAKYNTTG